MFTPNTLGPTVEITAFTLTGVSTLFYCRLWVAGRLKLYDFIMLAALLCTWGLCVINHYQVYYGTGERAYPLPKDASPPSAEFQDYIARLTGSARSWYAYQIMYVVDQAFIKFSILVFYLSIATHRTFRFLVYASLAAVAIFHIAMLFLNAFECPNPSLALSSDIFFYRMKWGCLDLVRIYYSQAGFSILADMFILALPLPILIKLRMPKLKRFCLLAVFSIGMLVPIASTLRVWALYLWYTSGAQGRYYGAYVLFWDQVEINTAIICASAPSLQPLFKKAFGELSRFQRSRDPRYYYCDGPGTRTGSRRCGSEENQKQDATAVLQTPGPTYQPQKYDATEEMEYDIVLIRELGEEEEIRSRVRQFSTHRTSTMLQPPNPRPRPMDVLSHR
ncbi:hypothetical protein BS50DRAFT_673051 [Corynespora cassiicola Philippines]|uniref:Rhodopsin domain-containing protein n=1 Tax=Corynespora cassiicola Philippines TaxID=1448308 RepID=A0A2T2P3F8_CORCC|nr:hypothetical protein BS50DRAFT_673051 [Corynespora cassiicola Philippines]